MQANVGTRRRARSVTYGTLGVLLAVALVGVDFWPFSAYRLFSSVRTAEGSGQRLVVGLDDGTEQVVGCVSHPVLRKTMRFVPSLPAADPETRDVMLGAWFADCGIDGDDVTWVRIDQVDRVTDPVTLEATETAVTTVWEEDL